MSAAIITRLTKECCRCFVSVLVGTQIAEVKTGSVPQRPLDRGTGYYVYVAFLKFPNFSGRFFFRPENLDFAIGSAVGFVVGFAADILRADQHRTLCGQRKSPAGALLGPLHMAGVADWFRKVDAAIVT